MAETQSDRQREANSSGMGGAHPWAQIGFRTDRKVSTDDGAIVRRYEAVQGVRDAFCQRVAMLPRQVRPQRQQARAFRLAPACDIACLLRVHPDTAIRIKLMKEARRRSWNVFAGIAAKILGHRCPRLEY
jgi:hypothetical protein